MDVPQAKMSAPFDKKLEHLLNTYYYIKSDKHEIWQVFVENNILTYDEFVDSQNLESLRKMKYTKGTTSVDAFSSGKLILVNNVLLYYNFLRQEGQGTTADDSTLWDKADFRDWKRNGFHLSTKAQNTIQAGNTANTANSTLKTTNTAAKSKQKLQDDAWLSWRRGKQDENAYLLLKADCMYTDWILKFERKIASGEMSRMIDPNFHKNQLGAGSDTELFNQQENHLASILERVLQTSEGKMLTRKHPGDPRQVWELHQTHSTSSATSSNICTGLGQELAKLKIVAFDTPTKGLDTFDSCFTNFNKVSPKSQMPNSLAIMYLQSNMWKFGCVQCLDSM